VKTRNQRIRYVSSNNRGHRAFTLIELLVVIAVILILVGISLKMMAVVTNKTGTAKTLYVLEQTRNALEAYSAAVGSYPNTTVIQYVHCIGRNTSGVDLSGWISGTNNSYGLSYYLGYEDSNPRYMTWRKFVLGVNPAVIANVGIKTNLPPPMPGFDRIIITNSLESIRDAWDQELIYQPNANCDGYVLFSIGPDGAPGTKDDIGITKNE